MTTRGIGSPCSANIALKRFFPRVNPPMVVKLKMASKVLSTQLTLPRPFHPVHWALVDCKGIVVVDDNLAERAADGGFRFRLVVLLLHLVLTGITQVVDPLMFEKKCLRINFNFDVASMVLPGWESSDHIVYIGYSFFFAAMVSCVVNPQEHFLFLQTWQSGQKQDNQ